MSVKTPSPDSTDGDLRSVVEDLASRVSELEDENQQLRERVSELESQPTVEWQGNKNAAGSLWVDDYPLGKAVKRHGERLTELEPIEDHIEDAREVAEDASEDAADVQENIREEQKTRSQQDTRIERRINAVAEKAGVEVTDADLTEDDKLTQLLSVGVDAVTDRVFDVHHRARALLQNPREWGDVTEDANGVRVVYRAPDVRPYLEAQFNQSFSSSQISRVFSKIEELAGDSPRRVTHRKTDEGTHMLRVGVLHEDDPLYWNEDGA